MKKRLPKLNKQSYGLIFMAAFIVIGVVALVLTKAATPTAVLSLSPSSGSVNNGSSITVGLYEDSGSQAINSVSVGVSYDASKLTFVSATVPTTGTPFTTATCPDLAGGSGSVTVTCFISPSAAAPSVTGKQLIANLVFTAKVGTGSTSLNFQNVSSEKSAVFLAGTGENIWNGGTTGATFSLTTPDTTAPSISWTAPANGATVSGSAVAVTAGVTDGTAVSSVNLYVGTSTTPITMTGSAGNYTYTWDSTKVADGATSLTIKAKDPAGNEGVATRSVTVNNAKPNLTVSSVSLSPTAPNTGDLVTVSAVVTNNGTAAIAVGTSYSTVFKVDSATLSTVADSAGLAVNGAKTITSTVKWTAAMGGHSLTAETDSAKAITEINESDNIAGKSIVVYTLGDTNGSGDVTITDLNTVLNNWGKAGQSRTTGDLNGDGNVTITDLNQVLNNWTR
jgi:hypothetical protein